MEKYLTLFLLFFVMPCFGATDTFEGQELTSDATIEGVATTDTIEGQELVSACTPSLMQTINADGTTTSYIGSEGENNYVHVAGKFTASSSFNVSSVTVSMRPANDPTGRLLYAKIWSHNGATGKPLAVITNGTSQSVDVAIPSDWTEIEFTWPDGSRPVLTNTVVYHLGVFIDGVAWSYVQVRYNETGSGVINQAAIGESWQSNDNSADLRAALYGCAL